MEEREIVLFFPFPVNLSFESEVMTFEFVCHLFLFPDVPALVFAFVGNADFVVMKRDIAAIVGVGGAVVVRGYPKKRCPERLIRSSSNLMNC